MTAQTVLPVGMKLNNPGNLREAMVPDIRTKIVNGRNQFATIELGVEALARRVMRDYGSRGLFTLPMFIKDFAKAVENDVSLYIRETCRLGQYNPLLMETTDMRLDYAWNALHLMRTIVAIEQGRPGIGWKHYPEWISPTQWVLGMQNAHQWSDL